MTPPSPWQAQLITQWPAMFPGPLGFSLAAQARKAGRWQLRLFNLFDYGRGRHKKLDEPPAGGGPGMVLRADVAAAAVAAARAERADLPLLWMSASGARLTQARIQALAQGPGALFFCSRFEGVDQRVMDALGGEEICIGDYVLAGGEIAAMVMLDAIIRLLPGVVGDACSPQQESFAAGLLEHAQYTRPAQWQGRAIPRILLSGHHKRIAAFRRANAEARTRARRPDLWRQRQPASAKGESESS